MVAKYVRNEEKMRIASAQMRVEGGEYQKNIEKVKRFIEESAKEKADIVVFPEVADFGWLTKVSAQIAEKTFKKSVAQISRLATENSIYVCIGLTEGEGREIYNSAILISPSGKLLLKHRKINLLDFEAKVYSKGESLLVTSKPAHNTGILICADNFPDTLYLGRTAGLIGVKLLLSPSSWVVEDNLKYDPDELMWVSSYFSLAREFGMVVVAVSNVGTVSNSPWKGHKCIGNSVIIGDGGRILHRSQFGQDAERLDIVDVQVS